MPFKPQANTANSASDRFVHPRAGYLLHPPEFREPNGQVAAFLVQGALSKWVIMLFDPLWWLLGSSASFFRHQAGILKAKRFLPNPKMPLNKCFRGIRHPPAAKYHLILQTDHRHALSTLVR